MNAQPQTEQRKPSKQSAPALKSVINEMQSETLRTIEQFGWYITFLRPQANGGVLAVVFDPDLHAYAVIEQDGALVKNPEMRFRPS